MKFEMEEQDVKILSELLRRVQLTGAEVPAFNKIIGILNNPIKEELTQK